MVEIYKKYWVVVNQLGTISMSNQDRERLHFLEEQLGLIKVD